MGFTSHALYWPAFKKKLDRFTRQKARLAYFYGWTNLEIENLHIEDFDMYLLASNEIETHNIFNNILASDMPHMKGEDRKRMHNQLRSSLPKDENQERELSLEELGVIIARGGI